MNVGKLIEDRCLVFLAPETTQIGIALIIGEDDHNIRLVRLGGVDGQSEQQQGGENEVFHR